VEREGDREKGRERWRERDDDRSISLSHLNKSYENMSLSVQDLAILEDIMEVNPNP